MDAVSNPFAPGAGARPPELVGRRPILDQAALALARVKLGRSATSLMAVGLRGVGKTVWLNEINHIAERDGYVCEMIEAPEGRSLPSILAPALRTIVTKLDQGKQIEQVVRRAFRILRSFVAAVKVSYADVELSLDGEMEPGTADSGDIEGEQRSDQLHTGSLE